MSIFIAVALVAIPVTVAGQSSGLHILLTNEDGYDAPGLTTLRDALVDAGHTVTVVAPLDDRSGSGTAATLSGVIDYYEQSAGVWAIDGTPVDAVSLALVHVLRERPPDLVVAGADFGHNVGQSILASGVVGAALSGTLRGIPGIAVSVAIDPDEANASPAYPSTTGALGPAAAFVVDLVRQLHESDAQGLLPPRQILNVNYPAVGALDPVGVRFAPVASVRAFRQVYAVGGDTGPARAELAPGNPDRAEGGSDFDLLSDGYVTISVLDGNVDAGPSAWESLRERLVIER